MSKVLKISMKDVKMVKPRANVGPGHRTPRVDRHGDNIPTKPRIEGSRTRRVEGYDHIVRYAWWLLRKQPQWVRMLDRYKWQGEHWPDGHRESGLREDLEQEINYVMMIFKSMGHMPTTEDARWVIMRTFNRFLESYGLGYIDWGESDEDGNVTLNELEVFGYDDRWPWRAPFVRQDRALEGWPCREEAGFDD